MTEFIDEKIQPFKQISKDQRDELAKKIVEWNVDFNKKRQAQIETALRIQKHIYINQDERNSKDNWKSNLRENKLYTTADTMKAIMWKEIWSNEAQMFDVAPLDKQAEDKFEKQKQAIVKALKDMKAGVQYDLVVDYWMQYGDFIFLTDWKRKEKTVKRYDVVNGLQDTKLPVYDNANITAINPMFFTWDVTSYKLGDEDSWNSCIKIYKRFETIENIKNNKVYTLTKEQIEELKTKDETDIPNKQDDNQLKDTTKYGDSYEVLYLQGDFTFDGKTYKNVIAEVFAGKYLIRFEENPLFICPFVWGAVEVDINTLRGISPLKPILNMIEAKEEAVNSVIDGEKLNLNPPRIMDENTFKDKDKNVELSPGGCIYVSPDYKGNLPEQMQFNTSGLFEVIGYIANATSDASSINANSMGNTESGKRLATDLRLAEQGTNSRTALKLDKIYQINLQVIKNVAELLAMFKQDSEYIIKTDMGRRVTIEIDNAVRSANYDYIYEDRNALLDRRSKFQEIFQIFLNVAKDPELKKIIDWREAITTGVEMTGFDNPDKFFVQDSEPVAQMREVMNQLPDQAKDQVATMVLQTIGGMNVINNNSGNYQETPQA